MFLSINAALFFNSYVNPIALDALDWKYYIVYDVWIAIELATVYFAFVETRNTPLEEIARLFDGNHALVGGDWIEKEPGFRLDPLSPTAVAESKLVEVFAEEKMERHE